MIARALFSTGALAGLIIEQRENHIPSTPTNIPDHTAKLFTHHFKLRANREKAFFSDPTLPDINTLRVSKEDINSPQTHQFIKKIMPDLLLSYGVHKLTNETLDCTSGETWNIHGGLSPWYKGVITHFWPSYMLEPQMTGMTVHDLTQQLDAGAIVHQAVAPMISGDGLHDVACRAVTEIASELPRLLEAFDKRGVKKEKDKTNGKLWLAKDWRPAHLHKIYDHYNDKIVDAYLNGDFEGSPPKLHRQFY
jgi:methionyl-tRNA formyltransferase